MLKVVKTSTTTQVTTVGQIVDYRFAVSNPGNTTLTGITVSDAIVGQEGAARLEAMDRETAAWDARMNTYLTQRAQILSDPSIAPDMKPKRIEALRAQSFKADEQLRVTALEGLHDETVSVAKGSDELWVGVKCQANAELAGSPRNALRCSPWGGGAGGSALLRRGGVPPTNPRQTANTGGRMPME